MKKGKLMRFAALFFALMICFTVLSRAADQTSVAVVTVERPQSMTISHDIKATGKVVQNQDMAVVTLTDQRVSAVYVSEGDRVSAGDVLFEVDTALLDEKILYQQQELEKQDLQVGDAKSQKDVNAMQKANSQAQAQEQYALSTRQAKEQLSRAETALSDAKKKLKAFRKQKGSAQADDTVEEALEQTLEEKTEAYIQAQQELSSLEWKIENAVNGALQSADLQNDSLQSAALQANDSSYSQSSREEPEDILEEDAPDAVLDGSLKDADSAGRQDTGDADICSADESAELMASEASAEEVLMEETALAAEASMAENLQDGITVEEITQEDAPDEILDDDLNGAEEVGGSGQGQAGGAQAGNVQAGGTSAGNAQAGGTQAGSAQAGAGLAGGAQKSEAEIEQSVRDSYSQELRAAQNKVKNAKEEQETAESALTRYRQEFLESSGASEAEQEEQLAAAVETARQAYVDASLAYNEAAVTGGRGIQTAGIPDAANSTDRIYEITYEQMELELEKLQELRDEDGKVTAPTDGLVTKLNVSAGEKTVDGPAVVMADLSKGFRFVADITKEQEKYIGAGDLVTLTGNGKNQKFEELEVESVAADELDDSVCHVTVRLPEDTLELGAAATMDYSRKSEAYSVAVPLTALHLDEKNQYYVLVTEEYNSIMGTETRARRLDVTVQEKNDASAGLAEGTLSSQQEIITGSDKAVDDGSRVRIQA